MTLSLEPTEDHENRVCPFCDYRRQVDDDAATWRCPKCGKAYEAFAQPTTSPPKRPSTLHKKASLPAGKVLATVFGLFMLVLLLKPAEQIQVYEGQKIHGESIIMLSTTRCGYCKAARRYFKAENIAYTDLDVERTEEGARLYRKVNARGVPVFIIGDRVMFGFNQRALQAVVDGKG